LLGGHQVHIIVDQKLEARKAQKSRRLTPEPSELGGRHFAAHILYWPRVV